MKKIIFLIFLFCIDARSDPINVDVFNKKNFGCTFDNFDFYLRTDLTEADYIQNDSLTIEVFREREKLFAKLVESAGPYNSSKEINSVFPEQYLEKVFFEYNSSRFTFYRAVGPIDETKKIVSRIISFCYEGDFDNKILDNFIPKKKLQNLDFGSDGVFYLIDDNDFHVLKFIKENNKIKKLYIYGGYD